MSWIEHVVAFMPCRRTRAALGYDFEQCMQLHLPPCRGLSCAPLFLAHLEKLLVARIEHHGLVVHYPQNNVTVSLYYRTTDFDFRITVITKETFEIRLQVTLGQTVSEWGYTYTYGAGSVTRRVSFCNHPRFTSFRLATLADMYDEEENPNQSDVASVFTWTDQTQPSDYHKMSDNKNLHHFVSEGGQVVPSKEYAMRRLKLYADTL